MTALCSGKICTIFPEKGALNFWKACTIALEYSVTSICKELSAFLHLKHAIPNCKDFTFKFIYKKSCKIPLLEFLQLSFSSCHIPKL